MTIHHEVDVKSAQIIFEILNKNILGANVESSAHLIFMMLYNGLITITASHLSVLL